jgi:hypothetical protein
MTILLEHFRHGEGKLVDIANIDQLQLRSLAAELFDERVP